jgi:hypothetical protein
MTVSATTGLLLIPAPIICEAEFALEDNAAKQLNTTVKVICSDRWIVPEELARVTDPLVFSAVDVLVPRIELVCLLNVVKVRVYVLKEGVPVVIRSRQSNE